MGKLLLAGFGYSLAFIICGLERFHGEWNRVFRNGVDV